MGERADDDRDGSGNEGNESKAVVDLEHASCLFEEQYLVDCLSTVEHGQYVVSNKSGLDRGINLVGARTVCGEEPTPRPFMSR